MLSMNLKMHSYISETVGFISAVYLQMCVFVCQNPLGVELVSYSMHCVWDPWLYPSAGIPADIRSITLICKDLK